MRQKLKAQVVEGSAVAWSDSIGVNSGVSGISNLPPLQPKKRINLQDSDQVAELLTKKLKQINVALDHKFSIRPLQHSQFVIDWDVSPNTPHIIAVIRTINIIFSSYRNFADHERSIEIDWQFLTANEQLYQLENIFKGQLEHLET